MNMNTRMQMNRGLRRKNIKRCTFFTWKAGKKLKFIVDILIDDWIPYLKKGRRKEHRPLVPPILQYVLKKKMYWLLKVA